jgi:hypothetical protein
MSFWAVVRTLRQREAFVVERLQAAGYVTLLPRTKTAGTNEPRIFVAQADISRTGRGQAAEKQGDRQGRWWRADVGKQVFAVTSPKRPRRQWLGKASACSPPARVVFHLCPPMRIREAFRYFWPIGTARFWPCSRSVSLSVNPDSVLCRDPSLGVARLAGYRVMPTITRISFIKSRFTRERSSPGP